MNGQCYVRYFDCEHLLFRKRVCAVARSHKGRTVLFFLIHYCFRLYICVCAEIGTNHSQASGFQLIAMEIRKGNHNSPSHPQTNNLAQLARCTMGFHFLEASGSGREFWILRVNALTGLIIPRSEWFLRLFIRGI